jgi:hypothetical protein
VDEGGNSYDWQVAAWDKGRRQLVDLPGKPKCHCRPEADLVN